MMATPSPAMADSTTKPNNKQTPGSRPISPSESLKEISAALTSPTEGTAGIVRHPKAKARGGLGEVEKATRMYVVTVGYQSGGRALHAAITPWPALLGRKPCLQFLRLVTIHDTRCSGLRGFAIRAWARKLRVFSLPSAALHDLHGSVVQQPWKPSLSPVHHQQDLTTI